MAIVTSWLARKKLRSRKAQDMTWSAIFVVEDMTKIPGDVDTPLKRSWWHTGFWWEIWFDFRQRQVGQHVEICLSTSDSGNRALSGLSNAPGVWGEVKLSIWDCKKQIRVCPDPHIYFNHLQHCDTFRHSFFCLTLFLWKFEGTWYWQRPFLKNLKLIWSTSFPKASFF